LTAAYHSTCQSLAASPDGRTMPLDGTLVDLAAEIILTHEVR